MQFINKVSIRYFRSLHTVDVKKCTSVNIFSGRNDVGKSNVIKALNLFFNEQVDWESDFKFYDNFSKKRLEEVRKDSIKGKQFISVKLELIRPNNYKGSLPEKFTVERRWHRDSRTFEQSDNLIAFERANKLPSTLTTAQRNLAKYLNKLHFEYVPAIRDRTYVDELIGRLQRSLLDLTINQNEQLLETANTLATHIEGQIGELKQDFEEATNIETSIEPPSSIASLFQSFLVSTKTDDGNIPLKFRGDGLQSRYIASVLHYIAVNSKDFFIWGYEEPEITLEYSHASKMAFDFENKYSACAQIFVTTHSPAFIALDGDKVSCFRVSQSNAESIVTNTSIGEDLKGKEKLKEELGVIEIQREVHELYSSSLKDLKNFIERVSDLELEADEFHRPLVITEGRTDCEILNKAIEVFAEDAPKVRVRSCDNSGEGGSNGGAGTLGKLIESIHPEDGRLVIAIFDNDVEGQKVFGKLSNNFSRMDWNQEVKRHKNGFAWAVLLPEPGFRAGFVEAQNLCIEYMFRDDVLERKFAAGRTLEFRDVHPTLQFGGIPQENIPQEVKEALREHTKKYRKVGAGKESFSKEIVGSLKRDDFSAFEGIFEIVSKIVES